MSQNWIQAQKWEKDWWGNCINVLSEEIKQLTYANRMGLISTSDTKTPYSFDLKGTSVLDIGGGPTSLLLRCVNVKGKVIDPLDFPKWVIERYKTAEIEYAKVKAEEMKEKGWDEIWLYNVLEHTENPKKVIENAKKAGKIIRIFQWLNTGIGTGHIHTLLENDLNEWLNGEGKIEKFDGKANLWGIAYFGVFPTRKTRRKQK